MANTSKVIGIVVLCVLSLVYLETTSKINAAVAPHSLEKQISDLRQELAALSVKHETTLRLVRELKREKANVGTAEQKIKSYLVDEDFVTLRNEKYRLLREMNNKVRFYHMSDDAYNVDVFSFPNITLQNVYYGGGFYKKQKHRGLVD